MKRVIGYVNKQAVVEDLGEKEKPKKEKWTNKEYERRLLKEGMIDVDEDY